MTSIAADFAMTPVRAQLRQIWLPVVAGLACALAIAKALPATMDALSAAAAPLCATAA